MTEGDDPFSSDDLDTAFEALGCDDDGWVPTKTLENALCASGGGDDDK